LGFQTTGTLETGAQGASWKLGHIKTRMPFLFEIGRVRQKRNGRRLGWAIGEALGS
jgi:hypothetical protein